MVLQDQNLTIDQAKARQDELRRDFGQRLSQSRQLVGLSKQDLTHLTRISMVFIEALETGNFKAMPGEVFGRGFVRNICKVIGVDAEEYLGLFSEAWKEPSDLVSTGKKSYTNPKKAQESSISTPYAEAAGSKHFLTQSPTWLTTWLNPKRLGLVLIGVISLGALLAGLGRFLKNQESPPMPPQATLAKAQVPREETLANPVNSGPEVLSPAEATQAQVPQDSSSPIAATTDAPAQDLMSQPEPPKPDGIPAAEQSSEPAKTQPLTPAAPVGEVSQVMVRIKEPVELKIKLSGSSALETKTFEPGEFSFNFEDQGMLQISNAAAVEVLLNGKPLGPLGNPGQARKLNFSPKPAPMPKAKSS